MSKYLKINKLLSNSPCARLLGQARALQKLAPLLQQLLPAPLNTHCRLLAIRDKTLVLSADTPVWAVRLRFHAPRLVKQLARNQTVMVRTIQVRVRPPVSSHSPGLPLQPAIIRLGKSSTAALQQVAQTVSDARLKSALLRLASRQNSH